MPQTVHREQRVLPAPRTEAAGLVFQRCLWCGTPAYHRSFCRTCGSANLENGQSAGTGTVVRRYMPVVNNTFVIAMDEGFTVVCRLRDLPQAAVPPGARVRVAHPGDPQRHDLPVVELRDPARPAGPGEFA